jgi:hypothetical protein
VTYSGLFSSNHPARKDVILNPEARKGFGPRVNHLEEAEGKKIKLVKDSRWAKLLKRTFKIDVATCPKCQRQMEIRAAITDQAQITRYLTHLGLDPDPPKRHTARVLALFDDHFETTPSDWTHLA